MHYTLIENIIDSMARIILVLCIVLSFSFTNIVHAQDTLPRFQVRNAGSVAAPTSIISWINNYPSIKQISIQRSHDSLTGFKTILSIADPTAKQNGFADKTAPNDHMYYRLFINLDQGKFFFTPSFQAKWDTASQKITGGGITSVLTKETDGIKQNQTKPVVPRKPDWIPSIYVYTNKDGYVLVNLPDADRKKYHIKFFEENDTFLFELKNIKHPALTLDKVNFIHSGWFKFELYNEENLVERNKFYLPKDF